MSSRFTTRMRSSSGFSVNVRFYGLCFLAGWTLSFPGAFTATAQGDSRTRNWPQYRGAQSDGLATGITLPETWSDTGNVVWKIDVPGFGWSSPIIREDRIFVTSAVGEKELPTPHVGGYPGGHLQDKGIHRWML